MSSQIITTFPKTTEGRLSFLNKIFKDTGEEKKQLHQMILSYDNKPKNENYNPNILNGIVVVTNNRNSSNIIINNNNDNNHFNTGTQGVHHF